jgi:hypothetical protein
MAVLAPGWSLYVYPVNSATAAVVNFFWEAIFAEELDYIW